MVKISSNLVGAQTLHLHFQDLGFKEVFDAVWASASLLHIPYEELDSVFAKLHMSLKPDGILFASFKHGYGRRDVDNRTFYDMNENAILPYLEPLFTPLEIWNTPDDRGIAQSPTKAWLNVLMRKR